MEVFCNSAASGEGFTLSELLTPQTVGQFLAVLSLQPF